MSLMIALLLCLQDPPQTEKPKPEGDKSREKEVVIIGQRRESDVLDVPSGVTVVTAEQIKNSGATNVVEVIQKQTGFFSSGPGKGAQDQIVDLRGYNNGAGNGQRTLVLVDGRKTNSVTGSSTDFAAIPLDNIDRVEIVRGPAAALYGDTALAGVINIITKKGGKDVTSTVNASGGAWYTFHGAAGVNGSAEGAFFDFLGATDLSHGYRDHQKYLANDFTGRVDVPIGESLSGYVKVGHHGDVRERSGSLSMADIAQFGRRASVLAGSPSENRNDSNYIDLGMTRSLESLGELSGFFNYSGGQSWSDFQSAFGDFFIEDRSGIAQFQLKHVGSWKILGADSTFTTGLDTSYEDATARSVFISGPKDETFYRRRLFGAYENIEVRPIRQLIFSGGARYDRALLNLNSDPAAGGGSNHLRAFDQISPMAGLTVKVVDEVSVYGSYGRPFKYPTRDELIGFTASAPDLKPERAVSYETGVRAVLPRWGSASVNLYRMIVKDEIYFDPTFAVPPFGFGTNVNFDEVTHQGVESEARFTPCKEFELFGTHTFTRAVITEAQNPALEGKRYPVTPRLAGTIGGSVKYGGVILTLQGRYAGERLLVADFNNTQPPLPPYWVMDAKISYTWNLFTAFLSAYNLTDRQYFDNGGVSFTGNRFNPAPGRSWMAGGEVRF
jgi:outer membrane receptor protein involved in Fe transport